MLIHPGQQCDTGRSAHRTIAVKIREADALGGELVDVRRPVAIAAVAPQISVSQVIS